MTLHLLEYRVGNGCIHTPQCGLRPRIVASKVPGFNASPRVLQVNRKFISFQFAA